MANQDAAFPKVHMPFTPDQVQSLNEFQQSRTLHPFTCVRHSDEHHRNDGTLIATIRGWICAYCDYKQDWAHKFMADFAWKRLQPGFKG